MGNVLSYTCNGLGDKLLQYCAEGDADVVSQVSTLRHGKGLINAAVAYVYAKME